MPRKRNAVEEDELDDLVDELDEIEDEDEEVELVDEDPDEAPKKRGRKAKAKTAKKAKPAKEGVGTKEVADAAGIDSRQLRMFLRAKDVQPRADREGRYWWPSLESKEVKAIIGAIRKGELAKMNEDKLADLKERKGKKSKAKTARKKRSRAKAQ